MSSYWAGYHGCALVLKEKEFEEFLDGYCGVFGVSREELDQEIDSSSVREYPWQKSSKRKGFYDEVPGEDTFQVVDILTDYCDGMYLVPFITVDGKKNELDGRKQFVAYNLRNYNLYVIFADKAMDRVDAFDDKPYASYADFVQEFKDKLEAYLPSDFNWDSHLGSFSYASYA